MNLNAISLGSKTPHAGYVFAMPPFPGTLDDFDQACGSFRRMGFNSLYMLWPFYRSEDGSGTPWQEDIPPEDERYSAVARLTSEDRQAVDEFFRGFMKIAGRHDLPVLFNVGAWTPQTWFREHPDALSRLPEGDVQVDWIFKECGVSVYMPCFRSEAYRTYSEKIIDAWFRKYQKDPDFRKIVCRVRVDRDDIVLDRQGFELFFVHQDTMDRDWCYCMRCQEAFRRDYLPGRYGSIDGLNRSLGTAYASFVEIAIPRFPTQLIGHGSADQRHDKVSTSVGSHPLWFDASNHFSEAIHGWKFRITRAVKKWFPRADVMLISKHPSWPRLTDFPAASRGSKIFLMDPYPMEFGMHWNLLSYFFEVEVYQSAAAMNHQALFAHLQGFDNPRPGEISRAPTSAEFRQQHLGLLARGAGARMTLSMDLGVDIGSPMGDGQLLDPGEIETIVTDWHQKMGEIEECVRGTSIYNGGVRITYRPEDICSIRGARHLLKQYREWKARGVPVHVEWSSSPTEVSVPKTFEFQLENDSSDWDCFVRQGKNRWLVFVINLRNEPRKVNLGIALCGEDMTQWRPAELVFSLPVQTMTAQSRLACQWDMVEFGGAVLELSKQGSILKTSPIVVSSPLPA